MTVSNDLNSCIIQIPLTHFKKKSNPVQLINFDLNFFDPLKKKKYTDLIEEVASKGFSYLSAVFYNYAENKYFFYDGETFFDKIHNRLNGKDFIDSTNSRMRVLWIRLFKLSNQKYSFKVIGKGDCAPKVGIEQSLDAQRINMLAKPQPANFSKIAKLYLQGCSIAAKDPQVGIKYLLQGIECEDQAVRRECYEDLAKCYALGQGVDQSDEKAIECFVKSNPEKGISEAYFRLAIILSEFKQQLTKAFHYTKIASSLNNPDAVERLYQYYALKPVHYPTTPEMLKALRQRALDLKSPLALIGKASELLRLNPRDSEAQLCLKLVLKQNLRPVHYYNLYTLYLKYPSAMTVQEARKFLTIAADMDHQKAIRELAKNLSQGLAGFPKLTEEGARYAKRMCAFGYADDYLTYGNMLMQGVGVAKDTLEGTELLLKAANLNQPTACLLASNKCEKTLEGQRESLAWLIKGVENGDTQVEKALFNALKNALKDGSNPSLKPLISQSFLALGKYNERMGTFILAKENYEKSFVLDNNLEACYRLGLVYSMKKIHNQTSQQQAIRARNLAKAGALAGHIPSKAILSGLLYQGIGVAKDEETGFQYAKECYEAGSLQTLNVIYLHLKKLGKTQEAQYYLKKAADLKDRTASFVYGKLLFSQNTNHDPEIYKQAFHYFCQAYDLGITEASYYLGLHYFSGLGVDVDYELALTFFNRNFMHKSPQQEQSTPYLHRIYMERLVKYIDDTHFLKYLLESAAQGNEQSKTYLEGLVDNAMDVDTTAWASPQGLDQEFLALSPPQSSPQMNTD